MPKSAAALGFDAPVHALLTGAPDEFDRRIEVLQAPRYGIVGQSRTIESPCAKPARPAAPSRAVTLKIRREGRPDETRHAPRSTARSKSICRSRTPGTNIVEVELDTAPGELTPANNRAVIAAEGVRENLRVLLVSGEPHAGERTWRNLLKSDAAVDLVHFTILRPPEKQDGTPINQLSLIAFPTRELFSEKIKDFDLIIFDRYEHRGILQLLYYDNIARYVDEHGGALLVAAGDDYASNVHALPHAAGARAAGAADGTRARDAVQGQDHGRRRKASGDAGPAGLGAVRRTPAWGRWFRQAEVQRRARPHVLMSGAEDKPLLVLDRKGKGRVALLTSDQAWLWARGYEGGGPHTDLLRRLSHWLMKEPDLEEERLIATAQGLEADARAPLDGGQGRARDAVGLRAARSPTVDARSPPATASGARRSMSKMPGLYKAETQGPSGPLTAVAHAGIEDPREMSEVTATDDKLQPIADATGGGVFWTRASRAHRAVQPVIRRRAAHLHAVERQGARRLRLDGPQGSRGLRHQGVKLTPMFTGFWRSRRCCSCSPSPGGAKAAKRSARRRERAGGRPIPMVETTVTPE